jgi:putative transposase
MSFTSPHRLRLPHQYPQNKSLFLTLHLYGSWPPGVHPPSGEMSNGEAVVRMERYLDTTLAGPMLLKDKRVAQIVAQSLFTGQDQGHYILHAYVIMANHVHILMTPLMYPSQLLGSLKGATSREANRILGRTGEPFWQHESHDHWVRDEEEFERIRQYIENSPVRVSLDAEPSLYRWSSRDCGGMPADNGRSSIRSAFSACR